MILKGRDFSISSFLTLSFPLTNLDESIKKIEDQMYIYAKEMEFEKAAQCRDKIKYLKRRLIDL